MYTFLCGYMSSFVVGTHLGVELLDHMAALRWTNEVYYCTETGGQWWGEGGQTHLAAVLPSPFAGWVALA